MHDSKKPLGYTVSQESVKVLQHSLGIILERFRMSGNTSQEHLPNLRSCATNLTTYLNVCYKCETS